MHSKILGIFDGIIKRFNSSEALSGLNFKIYAGINGLIGPNGAGKTTTIKVCLGLIRTDEGRAEMFGFDCWKESFKIRQKIGVLYEKVAYYDHLNGIKHLQLVARLKGIKDPIAESNRVLNLVDLEPDVYNQKIKSYSAGMRQKVGLAHALLGNPELVILDEPTSNLDPLGRARVIKLIKKLNKEENVSFLVSSHILPELERVCEHVILMNKGKAILEGQLKQLLSEVASQTFMITAKPVAPLINLLKMEDCVDDLRLEQSTIFVVVNDSDVFKKRLPELVSTADASLEEVKIACKDLESLFKDTLGGS